MADASQDSQGNTKKGFASLAALHMYTAFQPGPEQFVQTVFLGALTVPLTE